MGMQGLICFLVVLVWNIVKQAEGTGLVQVRVDSFTVDREDVARDACCQEGSCICGTRMRACVFVRNESFCRDDAFQTSAVIGQFDIGRTPTLFGLETDDRLDNLALRIQMRYGPSTALSAGTLINQYVIDISSVPVGRSELDTPWITFTAGNGLRPFDTDVLRVQVKIFCARHFYGEQCTTRCEAVSDRFTCDPITGARRCVGHWLPPLCQVEDVCQLFPCLNGGRCTSVSNGGYTCTCDPLYTGPNCSLAVDSCASQPCDKGVCHDQIESYKCVCLPGYTGRNCDQPLNDCRTTPCENGGRCQQSGTSSYLCRCPRGFSGSLCQNDVCSPSPCLHGGTCRALSATRWSCSCPPGFTGSTCDVPFPCASNPCLNGGVCLQTTDGQYRCDCPPLFTGQNCVHFDPCLSSPCLNGGTCSPEDAFFTCRCQPGWSGAICHIRDPCASNPCGHNGRCIGTQSGESFRCTCTGNYTGLTCMTLDPCANSPCLNGGRCSPDDSGAVRCRCRPGYTGERCQSPDRCGNGFNPCQNGGSCVNTQDGHVCRCPDGYSGRSCEVAGPCVSEPCRNGGSCFASGDRYICLCEAAFTGSHCQIPDPCRHGLCRRGGGGGGCEGCDWSDGVCVPSGREDRELCHNGGRCITLGPTTYRCDCPEHFSGPTCAELSSCFNSPCLNGGICRPSSSSFNSSSSSSSSSYLCSCLEGFRGSRCEEDVRLCLQNPCQHGGTCHVISGGRDVVCRCTEGWGGERCENDVSACRLALCFNGGSCAWRGTTFGCLCDPGFSGERCEERVTTEAVQPSTHPLTSPCLHHACKGGATCVPLEVSYTCLCPPHLTGLMCEVPLNPCQGVSCINGGLCVGLGVSPVCLCPALYGGADCGVPRDPCALDPCQSRGVCSLMDFTPGGFVCSCFQGFSGERCEFGGRDVCSEQPCAHGGSCVLVASPHTFRCLCTREYTGTYCEHPADPCLSAPCLNGGTCTRWAAAVAEGAGGGYQCRCEAGFRGQWCEESASVCGQGVLTCDNGGTCSVSQEGLYFCQCAEGFTGRYCQQVLLPEAVCGDIICQNYGTCRNSGCQCLEGWGDRDCSRWERGDLDCPFCGAQGVCFVDQEQPVCYCPHPAALCSTECSTPNALQAHPYNHRLFVHCSWGVAFVKECPANLFFNAVRQICDWPVGRK